MNQINHNTMDDPEPIGHYIFVILFVVAGFIILLLSSCNPDLSPKNYDCIYAIELEADSIMYSRLGDSTEYIMRKAFDEFQSTIETELNILVILQRLTIYKDKWKYPIFRYGYESNFIDSVWASDNFYNNRMVLDFMPKDTSPWNVPWYCYVYYYDDMCETASYNAIGWDLKGEDINHYLVGCMLHEFGHIIRMTHLEKGCTAMSVSCPNFVNTYHAASIAQAKAYVADNCCPINFNQN